MFAARNLANVLALAVGTAERAQPQQAFHPAFFNISEMPIPAGKLKAAAGMRDPGELDRLVTHIVGVNGGFGISKAAIAKWEAALAAGGLEKRFPVMFRQLFEAGALEDAPKLVRRLAMWERWRNTPYHGAGIRTGDVIANRSLSQRSYHAGPGNGGAGVAFDCGSADKLTDDFVKTCQWAMVKTLERMRSVGHPDRLILVEPHRASDKGRRQDPGKEPWERIVIPVVDADPRLTIDYEVFRSSGLPVPVSWDKRAHFDDKGKRIHR
jgi:hypothetical protein